MGCCHIVEKEENTKVHRTVQNEKILQTSLKSRTTFGDLMMRDILANEKLGLEPSFSQKKVENS